jgi:hypothetical protein
VQVADQAQPTSLAHEIHDQARRFLALLDAAVHAPLAEQAAGIEVAAQPAQIGIDIGVLDGAVDGCGIVAGKREWPDGELPVAHVQGYADGGAQFVAIALVNAAGDNLDAAGIGDDAVDLHGLGHHAAEVFPHAERDRLALPRRLFGEGDGQVVECPLVAPVIGSNEPPRLGRDAAAEIERHHAHQRRDQP